MSPRFNTTPEDAQAPFVIGLDVGSGGARAAVYDVSGREVDKRNHKEPHGFTVADDGTSTIDADQIVDELRTSLHRVLDETLSGPVLAIGFDTFASTLVVVDQAGNAITPCITYADTRCHTQVTSLREQLDTVALHDRTGARLHSSYTAPRLAWLREEHPDIFARAHRFMALGEYVALKLLGTPALGTASAAWSGMIDRRTGEYVPELLEAVGVGDGLAAHTGIGAYGPTPWGISTATSGAIRQLISGTTPTLPSGLWAYRMDADRTLVGSAMSDCGRVLDWCRNQLQLPPEIEAIEASDVFTTPPEAGTPLVIPFLSGERGTKWRDSSRAMMANVSASTTSQDILRGALEGVALSFLRIADQLKEMGGEPEQIVLSGGMTGAIPSWLHLLADALGAPIDHVDVSRSTMRGSAVLALEQAAPGVAPAQVPVRTRVEPVAAHAEYYRERLERFEKLADLA